MAGDGRYIYGLRSTDGECERMCYVMDDELFAGLMDGEVKGGSVDVEVSHRDTAGCYELRIEMSGDVRVTCDRCLGEMTVGIEAEERLYVRNGDVTEQEENEDGTIITIAEGSREVDLEEHLKETAVLNIPLRHVHEDGGCDEEMRERLEETMAGRKGNEGEAKGMDPRWSDLSKLIK